MKKSIFVALFIGAFSSSFALAQDGSSHSKQLAHEKQRAEQIGVEEYCKGIANYLELNGYKDPQTEQEKEFLDAAAIICKPSKPFYFF